MEFLLNFVWFVVSLFLLGLWTRNRLCHTTPPRPGRPPLLPGSGTQLVALVLLIAILFPVISLTDDLMMSATLAETEHAQRLDLLHDGVSPLPHALPGVLAALALAQAPARPARHELVPSDPASPAHSIGFYRPVESRPPPVA